jgi:hypothetical protein
MLTEPCRSVFMQFGRWIFINEVAKCAVEALLVEWR